MPNSTKLTIEHKSQALPHGITLQCRSAGQQGRPTLMFLHGFPEAAFVWDEYLLYFAALGFYCIAPNLRGYGDSYGASSSPPEVSAYRAKHLVQDIAALVDVATEQANGQLHALIAHDWGGAVAWSFANQLPQKLARLAIINSPHPGTFLRELQRSPNQQSASAYMNFLIRPDAEKLLAEDDYRRLWEFFTNMKSEQFGWLTPIVKDQYRAAWELSLTGGCNYYRASPLRACAELANFELPREMLSIHVPTHIIWGMGDVALQPALLEGLEDFIPNLSVHKVDDATHWITHEKPELVKQLLTAFFNKG